jgi:uncharacterized protein YcfJ
MFKKYFTSLMMFLVLFAGLPFATAITAEAQTRVYYNRKTHRYYYYKKPNFYRRHRKAMNIGIGTGIGALAGGLIGGRRGLAIGSLAGAGGGYLVTKKQKSKHYYKRKYVRVYRHG